MWKYLKIYIFIIFCLLIKNSYGSSEIDQLKMSDKTVNAFFDYISSDRKPQDKFLVTLDGSGTFVWACPQTLCFPAGNSFYTRPCAKTNKGKKCKIFAVGRKIKWHSGNIMSQDLIKIKQSENLTSIKRKLKRLGFID